MASKNNGVATENRPILAEPRYRFPYLLSRFARSSKDDVAIL